MKKSVSKSLQDAKIVQKMILEKNGKILLIKRSYQDESFAGWWDLPGGKVHNKEEHIKAVAREVLEETKLRVSSPSVRAFYLWAPSNKYILIGYTTDKFSGSIHLSSEHPEYCWISLRDSLKMKVQPIVKRLLRYYSKLA